MTRFVAIPLMRTEMADILSDGARDFLSHKHKDYLAAVAELIRR